MTVLGTRPEAVKLAPVVLELASRPREFESLVCATAQHRELLDQVLGHFGIRPDDDLDLMQPGQDLAGFASRALAAVSGVLERRRPDVVLVQGDTTTVMVAALAAFYRGIPVGHVEAGLRSGDRRNPFPEEMNRRVASVLATWHFAPTARAAEALRREQVEGDVLVTGNTVVDAFRLTLAREAPAGLPEPAAGRRLVLVTAHRRESFGAPLESVCHAVADLAERHPDVEVVFPVHPNPSVRATAQRVLGGAERVRLVEPLRYEAFVHLLARAHLVLTDSGGIQEESTVLGKPTLVLRDVTERPEAVEAGNARLVGTVRTRVVEEASRLLDDPQAYAAMARRSEVFGDGQAARRIVDALRKGA